MTHLGNRDAPGEPAWCGAAHVVSTYNCDASVSAIALAYLTGKVTCAACLEANPHGREVLVMLAGSEAKLEAARAEASAKMADLRAMLERVAQVMEEARRAEEARHVQVARQDLTIVDLRKRCDDLSRERAEVRAAVRELAGAINEHDNNADMFDQGDECLASVRAVVEKFLRAQGHPVADEWATRRFAVSAQNHMDSSAQPYSAPGRSAQEDRRLAWKGAQKAMGRVH